MPLVFILTAALAWFLYVMGSYYSFNLHYLGIGAKPENDFLSFGYLFSIKSLHFVLFILLFILIYYSAYYFLYKRKQDSLPKKQALKLKPEIKVRPIVLMISMFLFVFINIAAILIIRPPEGVNALSGTTSFAMKVAPTILYLIIFTLTIFSSGSRILELLKIKIDNFITRYVLTSGVGMIALYLLLFILGTSGYYNAWTITISAILLLISGFKYVKELVSKIFTHKIIIPLKPNFGIILFVGIIVVILTNNFTDLTRPIGVGWDDLTRYINFPKLLAGSGQTPSGNFGWPLLLFSGIGFAVTNSGEYGNLFLFANALFYQILLVAALVGIGRTLKLKYSGLLSVVIFLTTPMIVQQLIFDTKTDIGLTAVLTIALLSLLIWRSTKNNALLLLVGLFIGMALGIKVTALIGIISIVAVLLFLLFKWPGLLLSFAISFIGLGLFGGNYFEKSLAYQIQTVLYSLAAILIIISFIHIIKIKAFKKMRNLKAKLIPLLIFSLGFLISFVPILAKNLYDSMFVITTNNVLVGVIDKPMVTTDEFYNGLDYCERQGFTEEVVRYIGFEQSLNKYFNLPWNVTMNSQIGREYVDIGFIAFGAFTSLSFVFILKKIINKIKKEKIESKYEFNELLLPFIIIAVLSFVVWAFIGQSVPWYGMYIFVFILIIIEMLFTSLSEDLFEKINYRIFFGTLFTTALFAFIVASLKYDESTDLAMFMAVFITIIAVLFFVFRRYSARYFNSIFLGIVIFGILIQLGFRSYNSSNAIILNYSSGRITSNEFVDVTLYGYRYIDCVINGHAWIADDFDCFYDYYDETILDTPVYRIGTFVPYFIEKNNERIFEDSRLDKISCLLEQKNKDEALKHLQDLGFKYMIYDTNSETIETDPEGPVHKKVSALEEWLNTLRNEGKVVLCNIPKNKSIQVYNLQSLSKDDPYFNNCRFTEAKKLNELVAE